MIAIAITPCPEVLVGPCPAVDLARYSPGPSHPIYCLHDCAGVHLGTIPLPAARPTIGPSAPTLYLRRDRRPARRARQLPDAARVGAPPPPAPGLPSPPGDGP
jgi:hypothetical protein